VAPFEQVAVPAQDRVGVYRQQGLAQLAHRKGGGAVRRARRGRWR
jgi:hypothetical protein